MASQEERRQRTRRQLLEAASSVLAEKGVAGFSTVAVARVAQLSNGAVFNHFSTKLELLTATVEFMLADLRDKFAEEFLKLGPNPPFADMLSLLWDRMNTPEQLASVEIMTQARASAEIQAALTPIMQDHHKRITELAHVAAPETMANAPESVRVLSFMFIYLMVGLTTNQMVGAGRGDEVLMLRLGDSIIEMIEKDSETFERLLTLPPESNSTGLASEVG